MGIVFCVDQEHALAMRDALAGINADRLRSHPDYVARITSDEGGIGRGTRVSEDHGKLFCTILDSTGSAMQRFADPAFDGEPVEITREEMDAAGNTIAQISKEDYDQEDDAARPGDGSGGTWVVLGDQDAEGGPARKYHVDDGEVEIVAGLHPGRRRQAAACNQLQRLRGPGRAHLVQHAERVPAQPGQHGPAAAHPQGARGERH
jgi:type I restriction enzyme R subunit